MKSELLENVLHNLNNYIIGIFFRYPFDPDPAQSHYMYVHRSRGDVFLVEENTIHYVSTAYFGPIFFKDLIFL